METQVSNAKQTRDTAERKSTTTTSGVHGEGMIAQGGACLALHGCNRVHKSRSISQVIVIAFRLAKIVHILSSYAVHGIRPVRDVYLAIRRVLVATGGVF